jgi:gliding motility-associated-like protein
VIIKLFSAVHLKRIIPVLLAIIMAGSVAGQCPANIDFETGTFDGWTTYLGTVSASSGQNVITLAPEAPTPGRQDLIFGGNAGDNIVPRDYYGGFSEAAPNGSNYSVKLGNDQVHSNAEGMSYDFTIPATANQFSITYWYAVIFEDPGHAPEAQPRMEIEVTDLTDNISAGCSSFSFVAGSGLPGFFISPHHSDVAGDTSSVWCRDWTANTINLDNNEGKSYRIFFKTADCALQGHFGYAYIDVSSNCSSSFTGASYCPGDTSIDITAPTGYQSYEWFNNDFSQVLGTQPMLHLSPPPPAGSDIKVQVTPYPGYGCIDTLTAILEDTLHVTANAGGNKSACDTAGVQLGVFPQPAIVYKWTPATGLSNPNIANPIAHVAAGTTVYTLKASSAGGGCIDYDIATVFKPSISNAITLTGSNIYCTGSGTNSVLHVNAADSIQWYNDAGAIPGATHTDYTVLETGNYYANVFSLVGTGCEETTDTKKITVYPGPHASFQINNPVQCSPLDTFVLKNLSTISSGNMQYQWSLGDGTVSTEDSISHIYAAPGNYTIALHASATGGCVSDTTIPVVVKPGVDPEFSSKNICTDLPLPVINNSNAPGANTVNYLWNFGNGDGSGIKNPVYSYPLAGNYTITLSASTPECPDLKIRSQDIVVTAPTPATRYPDHPAIINYPEPLEARPIGVTALWSPAIYLNNIRSYKPTFRSFVDQQYTIKLTTDVGCVTFDTVLVKVYKKIEIHVPTAFTPNGDGLNDVLKPLLFGFEKVNYFRVFDRWGKELFESHDDLHGWDGTFKGAPLDIQTVIWIIDAVDVDGKDHVEKGMTTIMR